MRRQLVTIGMVAGVAIACPAGIKYWDNSEYKAFDVNCYVPGAVWNYDGICNAGADQPHSTSTTTRKNLGSAGSNNDVWVRYQKSGGGWSNSSARRRTDPLHCDASRLLRPCGPSACLPCRCAAGKLEASYIPC